jgi:hypothetical protein
MISNYTKTIRIPIKEVYNADELEIGRSISVLGVDLFEVSSYPATLDDALPYSNNNIRIIGVVIAIDDYWISVVTNGFAKILKTSPKNCNWAFVEELDNMSIYWLK